MKLTENIAELLVLRNQISSRPVTITEVMILKEFHSEQSMILSNPRLNVALLLLLFLPHLNFC